VVGKHRGIPFYTVGQRKGLGVSFEKPVYVKSIDEKTNTIEIANKEELFENVCSASDINFVSRREFKSGEIVFGKIRYNDIATPAEIISADESEIKIKFLEAKNAVTPGQSLVLYDEQGYVLAGGIIRKK
ncbi:MAG: tRNA methyl transferase PRC-barrel domain-containing protein, partial [Bacteroidota bacterium]